METGNLRQKVHSDGSCGAVPPPPAVGRVLHSSFHDGIKLVHAPAFGDTDILVGLAASRSTKFPRGDSAKSWCTRVKTATGLDFLVFLMGIGLNLLLLES